MNLALQINDRTDNIYRPYTHEFPARGGKYPPQSFLFGKALRDTVLPGCASVTHRKALRDQTLRGLLVKKFGFSIATRAYLEAFFGRTAFGPVASTGEIIIQHPNLLLNAARSDFENNSTKAAIFGVLSFVHQSPLNSWVKKIQQDEKARDVESGPCRQITNFRRTGVTKTSCSNRTSS